MFDPRSVYQRRMWHYESDRPLSVAQLIVLGSLDAKTAALIWLLIEKHTSVIVSGPTDPTPGVGKTTTLNALLDFLPAGTTLVYTAGMYEDFSFRDEVSPETTCVLANEVSDHLHIYMWGRVARQFLALPGAGFAIATSCHADTIDDVMRMLTHDLRLASDTVRTLGLIINIGLVGRVWPPKRRFLTVNLIDSLNSGLGGSATPLLRELAHWDDATDTQAPPSQEALAAMGQLFGYSALDLEAALKRREDCLTELAQGRGVGRREFRVAVEALMTQEMAQDLRPDKALDTPADE